MERELNRLRVLESSQMEEISELSLSLDRYKSALERMKEIDNTCAERFEFYIQNQ